jgi:hypothetical protein
MKKRARPTIFRRAWLRLLGRRAPMHDPLLSLSLSLFNFSSGWDRVLQKQKELGA